MAITSLTSSSAEENRYHENIRLMTLAKQLKPVVSEADKPALRVDDHLLHQAQLDLFKNVVQTFAFGVECRTTIFHPPINVDEVLLTGC